MTKTARNSGHKLAAFLAVLVMAVLPLMARNINAPSIDSSTGVATITFTAGSAGDGHVLYYAWSNDGEDKGADIAAWPNVIRLCRVADDATGYSFTLPREATHMGLYSARAFLATSDRDYDCFLSYIEATGAQYIDTGVLPNKTTAAAMDFKMTSTKGQQYVFGATTSASGVTVTGLQTFCAYINGSAASGGKWAFTCKPNSPKYTEGNGPIVASTSYSTQICLDAAGRKYTVTQNGTTQTTETPASTITTGLADVSIALFTRKHKNPTADTITIATGDTLSHLYCYSCSITNDGACVRNYLPAVKDGVAGMYDTINNSFHPSGSGTDFVSSGVTNITFGVDSGDTVAAVSTAFTQASPDFITHQPYVESHSLTFSAGGSKIGAAPLVLTGANSWGGTFTVNEGALIADFGQGLASTDNLVFNGGTYGRHSGGTFNWTIGNGGGETSLGANATNYGFTAYGNPFAVVAGGNAATPLEFGTASSVGFNPERFVLNDDWATDKVTFKNGITGSNSDASTPILRIYTGAAEAMVEGAVTGVDFFKYGAGTLTLCGANNSLGILRPCGGTLVIAPPAGESSCNLTLTQISNTTQNAANVIISNAVITQSGSLPQIWYGGTDVTLVGCTWSSGGEWWPGSRRGAGQTSTLVLDNSALTISSYLYPGYGGSSFCEGNIIITNGSTLTVNYFQARHGSLRQYSGTVKVKNGSGGVLRLGASSNATFDYYLYGGSLIQDSSGSSATFSLGMNNNDKRGQGAVHIYRGGTFTANGTSGFLGRYENDFGTLDICGGTFTMTKEDAGLFIGYVAHGVCEVSDGGLLDMQKGRILFVPISQDASTGRTGTMRITGGGTVKARYLAATTLSGESTSTLIIDGGSIVANAGSSTNDLIYGMSSASVGIGGAMIDTNGQDKKISQSFDAVAEQSAPSAATGSELAALPAFTKIGAGTLTLTGTNEWLCATCVSNGTLAVGERALPATTLRLGGGVIDLGGKAHTVANLVGTGVVSNGTLTVTGTVWPGVGDSGTLKVDSTATLTTAALGCSVAPGGACGCLEVAGAFDLTDVTIVAEGMANMGSKRLMLVKAASLTGSPATSKVDGYGVTVRGGLLRIGAPGFHISFR